MPTVLSLFSGVGTFDYGFQQAGWGDVPGVKESDRYRFMGNGGTSLVLKWLAERIRVWL